MRDEQLAIPSDITTLHRTPIDLTEDGRVQAIEINGDKHTMVLAFHRDGGVAVLGGVSMREVQRPSVGEAGARKMIEIYKVIEGLDIRGIDDDTAAAIDRLHAAVIEYRDFVENIRPDLPETERLLQEAQDKLGGISAAALRALQNTEEQPDDRQVVEHVRRLISALQVWQQGAAALIQQGVMSAGGKPALAAPGALREIVTSGDPLPFWSGLRETLAELRARAEAGDRKAGAAAALQQDADATRVSLEAILGDRITGRPLSMLGRLVREKLEEQRDDAGAAAQVREIRQVLEEFQGRTPDPARSTAQLAREVVAQALRWHDDIAQLEGEGLRRSDSSADAELARKLRIAAESIAEDDDPGRYEHAVSLLREAAERLRPETDVELHDRLARASPPAAEAQVVGAVKQVLGDVEVRLHKPGMGMLRIVVPATVPQSDADTALELLRTVVPATVQARIELEPGVPPEGYTIKPYEANDGEAPSSPHIADGAPPTRSWSLYEWHGEGATDSGFKSEAQAIDDAWNAYVDGQLPQDAADAEADA